MQQLKNSSLKRMSEYAEQGQSPNLLVTISKHHMDKYFSYLNVTQKVQAQYCIIPNFNIIGVIVAIVKITGKMIINHQNQMGVKNTTDNSDYFLDHSGYLDVYYLLFHGG